MINLSQLLNVTVKLDDGSIIKGDIVQSNIYILTLKTKFGLLEIENCDIVDVKSNKIIEKRENYGEWEVTKTGCPIEQNLGQPKVERWSCVNLYHTDSPTTLLLVTYDYYDLNSGSSITYRQYMSIAQYSKFVDAFLKVEKERILDEIVDLVSI